MTERERRALRVVADVLIPATDQFCSGASEVGFDGMLMRAVDARADAFDTVTSAALNAAEADDAEGYLRGLHDSEPDTFQALSAVVAGAWLLTPKVRDRIGYHGQQRHPAGHEDAADDLMDGILDPVLAMEYEAPGRWAR